jgi:uncharacterized membrane protein YozB (DUF420 family)
MKEFLGAAGFFGTAGTVGADLSYLLAVVFTAMFTTSWVQAKKGQGTKHHNLVFISMVSMVIYFTVYYFFRQLGVLALEGKEGFGGPEEVYNSVFVPILSVHLFLVTMGLILAFYMVIQGFRSSKKVEGKYILTEGDLKVRSTTFKKVMYILLAAWGLNQIILTFVRHASWQSSLAWALIFGTIALVISLEKAIEKWLPDGAKRHRVLGRGTMVVYILILVTSTLTYLMLYVIYPAQPV